MGWRLTQLSVGVLLLGIACAFGREANSREASWCSPDSSSSATDSRARIEGYRIAVLTFGGIAVREGGRRYVVPGSEGVDGFVWNRNGSGFFVTQDGVLGFLPIEGGGLRPIYSDWRHVRFPALSPDGATLAVSVNLTDDLGAGWEIWLIGPNGEDPRPVAEGYDTSWTPDGTQLYLEEHEPSVGLALLDLATGQKEPFLAGPDRDFSVELSPRGTHAAFSRGRARLMLYTFANDSLVELTDGSSYDRFANFSPDEEYVMFFRQARSRTGSPALQIVVCELSTGWSTVIEEGRVIEAQFASTPPLR